MFYDIMGLMKKLFGDYSSRELKSIYPIVDKIESLADEYKALSDAQLQAGVDFQFQGTQAPARICGAR